MAAALSAQQFFQGASRFAVAGASSDRSKYGNKVLRWYQDRKLDVTPVNPKAGTIEGIHAVACLSHLTSPTSSSDLAVSIITPPAVTTKIVQEAHAVGISRIWMQPGSESAEALKFGAEHDMIMVHDHCILISGDHARSQSSKV